MVTFMIGKVIIRQFLSEEWAYVVFALGGGGDLEEIDDFQMGSERLHDCITSSRLEPGTFAWGRFTWGRCWQNWRFSNGEWAFALTVSRLIPMRQKMTIFKGENSVWRVQNFYEDDFTYGHINFTKSILCWCVAMLWFERSRQLCKF